MPTAQVSYQMFQLARTLLLRKEAPPEELRPSVEALRTLEQQYALLRPVATLAMRNLSRFTVEGVENIPKEGPVILLMNHVALYDALHIAHSARRPVVFLASRALFKGDLRGRFLQAMGMIPKRKFTPDTRAIRTLRGWAEAGAAVGIFPEGERSWDGNPLPMVPGIGKLVRFLNAPVVTAQIHNGDHHWPRWAIHHRATRVHVKFSAPVRFDRRQDPQEIEQYIRDHIFPSSREMLRWPVRGKNLAHGLENLLFRCPQCRQTETLTTSANTITCSACTASWTIDAASNLSARSGPARDTTVAAEASRLCHEVETGWTPESQDGTTLMRSGPGEMYDQSGDIVRSLGPGYLALTPDSLVWHGEQEDIIIPRSELRAATIEERRRLWLLTSERILEPDLPEDSIVKWGWIVDQWRKAEES